jgi:hypothetical protein
MDSGDFARVDSDATLGETKAKEVNFRDTENTLGEF